MFSVLGAILSVAIYGFPNMLEEKYQILQYPRFFPAKPDYLV